MSIVETFESLELAELESWVRAARQEDLHLDFKLVASPPDFNREDRKNLAKAMSGFANSDGGLIVWGVDCRKDESGVDCARELRPMPSIAAALSKLQSLTGDATTPRPSGVRNRAIVGENGTGLLVTLVPLSDAGPHMAKFGEDRYFKRSGDSFYRMEHFDIADMVGRRPQPDLRLRLIPSTGGAFQGGNRRSATVQATVRIENVGRGLARFPFLKVRPSAPYRVAEYELDGNGRSGLPVMVRSALEHDWRAYAGGNDRVVYPGTFLDVTLISHEVGGDDESLADMVVDYVLAADGQQASTGSEVVPGQDLLALARERIKQSFPRP